MQSKTTCYHRHSYTAWLVKSNGSGRRTGYLHDARDKRLCSDKYIKWAIMRDATTYCTQTTLSPFIMTISRELGTNPMSFGSMFWENQFKTKIPLPPEGKSLNGKVAIITGANTGLGFECASQMLKAGLSHLIMGVRSVKRGQAAANQLQSINLKTTIDVWNLDMEDYQSIQKFASRCETDLERIDFVILNAGLSTLSFTLSKTGHEMDIQVNYLSTILLTILLLPVLKSKHVGSTAPPHLTLVSSATARNVKFVNQDKRPLLPSFDDTAITSWSAGDRYAVSKLLGQLTVERIADRYVDSKDVVINLVEPGWIRGTGLARDLPAIGRVILGLVLFIAGRPVDQGAATYFDAAVNQDDRSHGSYIMNCKPTS